MIAQEKDKGKSVDSAKKIKKIAENKKNHSLGHRQRLKEKLFNNTNLPDYEILELLLTYAIPRKDTKDLAKELLDRFGSIRGCLLAKEGELESVINVGKGVSLYFTLLRETISRFAIGKINEKPTFTTLEDFLCIAYPRLASLSEEEVWLACLDSQNRLISFECLFKGGIDEVYVQCRGIVELAIKRKASAIMLCHNHPGGAIEPSAADRELTKSIVNVCEGLDIRFFEHFVITEKGCSCLLAEKFIIV